MIKFQDVEKQTTEEYFNNNKFSIDAFRKKYAVDENETYCQALKRVCDYIASVEKTEELKIYWSERWFDEIYNDWWHPAGSIMQGAGTFRNISLVNCTTVNLGVVDLKNDWDNLESIVKNTAYNVAKYAAFRQGLGVDFSRLRPSGAKVLNSANESTGSIHWMKFIDSIGYYVGQKGRIPAMLFSLSIKHPDIEEFIKIKSDYTKIQNANISVQITNDFYKKVENDEEWELEFTIPTVKKGDKIYIHENSKNKDALKDENGWFYISTKDRKKEVIKKTVKARKLLELIAKNMASHSEPGIQNIDIARKYSNSDYLYDEKNSYNTRVGSTNACSEQYLSPDSCCVLASLNMENFSINQEEYEKELEKIGYSINRFLDNVNECELVYHTYATPEQRLAIEQLRRTGAGYTNLAAWLFKQNLEYGATSANNVVEKFTERYNYYLYKSSIELGKEKGNFLSFNKDKFLKSPFIKRMQGLGLEFESMRNVTCSSIAPTGSLSLMFRNLILSYGIEPAFFIYFWKRTRISGKYEYYFCVPSVVRQFFKEKGFPIPMDADAIKDSWDGKLGKPIAEFINQNKNKIGLNFKESTQIAPLDKLQLMSQVMKWIDSSISVTYMLPTGSNWKDVYNFIIEAYKREVKSIAAFPDRKIYGIVSNISFKELAFNLKNDGIEIHHQNFSDSELKELNLSREKIISCSLDAPERLETLEADIYIVSVKNLKFVIAIGLQNNQPYEIFCGHLNGLGLKTNYKKGKLFKVKKGQYGLEIDDIYIEDFSKQFTPTEQILFRMASLSLRHGVPIQNIVEQLQKATDDITSMASAASRVLKKYIKDGETVIGQKCPSCGKDLIYLDGCASCSCGFSKCS